MGDFFSGLLLIAAIVGFFRLRGMQKRIDRLERTLSVLDDKVNLRGAFPPPTPAAPEPVPDLDTAALAAPFEDGPTGAPVVADTAGTDAPRPVAPLSPVSPPLASELPPPPSPTRPAVFTPDLSARLSTFLRENWVYVVSALSLALAGVFLVQYGIERGLLTPPWRVTGALVLGAALVLWGERLRRRGSALAAYLPATFSGAGVVVIFAALVAARQLYGLIGPAPTLVLLAATGLGAIALGWYHGAFLTAIGLLGAAAAPFLTGGGGQAPAWFYLYFALVAVIGLAVDTLRRWAWVSVLALALGYAGALLSLQFGAGTVGWLAFLGALPLLATILPERSLVPRQAGPCFAESRPGLLPPFPVRLAGGTLLASAALILVQILQAPDSQMLGLLVLTLLALAFSVWTSAAPGLADLALLPALAFIAFLVADPLAGAGMADGFRAAAIYLRPPETAPPMTVTLIIGMLGAMLAGAGYRALTPSPIARWQGQAAVVLAGAAAGALEFFWAPGEVLGAFPWALEVIALAALTTVLALAFARRDGADRHRTATAGLIALSLIALALSILTAGTPLTLALAVLVVAAAALDRRFDLPEMAVFLQVGVAVLTWRIVVDPGVAWATYLPLTDFLTGFLGPIAAGIAGLWLTEPRGRPVSRAVLESGTALWIVGFLDAALLRWLDLGANSWVPEYLAAALLALPWIGGMISQAYRADRIVPLRRTRLALSAVSAVAGLGLMFLSAVPLNPLMLPASVLGPPVLSSLALAYLIPGLMILAAAIWMTGLNRYVRLAGLGVGAALAVLYLGLEIRRFWWGDVIHASFGVKQAELYTYTIAMMLAGAGLLAAALARHSSTLRRVAMAVIAVTIAKVFLLDAAGLTGLMRVLSFLGLGLSLAGLAWLNGVVDRATKAATSGPADPPAAP